MKNIHFISEPDIENFSLKSSADEDDLALSFQSFKSLNNTSKS
jgi:hypothetical protein